MMLRTPPGVYAPQHDTWLLTEALERENLTGDTAVLDVGTGSGALAVAAARCGAGRVTAVDVSALAVATAWFRARLEGLRIQVIRGDLLDPVASRRFDLIVANPPYVPSPDARHGRAVAWNAGVDGRAMIDRICRDAPPLLRPGGVLLLVQSALCGVEGTVEWLGRADMRAAVVDRRLIPFGPVLRGQAAWLEARGLIEPDEEKEELVVIRAERVRRQRRDASGTPELRQA
ncbi:methyltransferase [Streptomyces sp. NA02950]|uniref:HemK2/MTQ2 family protein methyltransferase n=1 Tax=Streptomyces sp. NA02950 TaxID=2742137 RepID=UPI00159224D4|nr:HemK2/MTQ2 family protein methyltransferase [Streptomyces sp. NA02950]QKV90666.1 methyltransferase [Streptomyces sp. NA02950]